MAYHLKTKFLISHPDSDAETSVTAIVSYKVYPGRAQTQLEPAEPASVYDVEIKPTYAPKSIADYLAVAFEDDETFKDWLLREAIEKDEYAREAAAEAALEDRRLGL